MEHKGWRNYETWNLHLWADRGDLCHKSRLALLDRLERPVSVDDVRAFFLDVMDGQTPDLPDTDAVVQSVDFDEIASAWERDRQFRRGLLSGH